MKKTLTLIVISMSIFFVGLIAVACNNQQNVDTSKADIEYGTKTETTKTLKLANKTGQDIIMVSALLPNEDSEMTFDSSTEEDWKNNAVGYIYLDNKPAPKTNEEEDEVLEPLYGCEVSFVLADDSFITIHNLDLDHIEEFKDIKLCMKDKIGYLEYTNSKGEAVNTFNDEKAIDDELNSVSDEEETEEVTEDIQIEDVSE